MRRAQLSTADIFLFNIPKSVDTSTEINYEMLESIKDGKLFSSKYDSQRVRVKTPNIVMVFSNNHSNEKKSWPKINGKFSQLN